MCASESRGAGGVHMQILSQRVRGGAWNSAFLPLVQVLPARRPHRVVSSWRLRIKVSRVLSLRSWRVGVPYLQVGGGTPREARDQISTSVTLALGPGSKLLPLSGRLGIVNWTPSLGAC